MKKSHFAMKLVTDSGGNCTDHQYFWKGRPVKSEEKLCFAKVSFGKKTELFS